MAQKYIMNENGSIDHKPFSSVSSGTFVITTAASPNASISGKGIYSGDLHYTFSGGNAAGFVNGSVETIDDLGQPVDNKISPTAANVRVNGKLVMRVDDEEAMVCWGVPVSTPPNKAIVPFATVIVNDAGQNKVTGD